MCEIANKIKARRIELGLTLEDVAQAVGVGRSTVQRWESGLIKNMGRDKIAALATVLQMSPVSLVPIDPQVYELTKSINKQLEMYNSLVDPEMTIGRVVSPEDEKRLEALHQDPRLGLLFDRSRKMSHEDVEFMLQMADRILKERDGDD